MHYRYRGSTVHSVPSPRYYREILPIPTVITAVTAVLPHSPLPCHSLLCVRRASAEQIRTLPWRAIRCLLLLVSTRCTGIDLEAAAGRPAGDCKCHRRCPICLYQTFTASRRVAWRRNRSPAQTDGTRGNSFASQSVEQRADLALARSVGPLDAQDVKRRPRYCSSQKYFNRNSKRSASS